MDTKEEKYDKTMSLREFYDLGLIQEINRRLLHPIGLALSVILKYNNGKDMTEGYEITGWGPIINYSDDPEGMRFDINHDNKNQMKEKEDKVNNLLTTKGFLRLKNLGYIVQPVIDASVKFK